MINRMGSTSRPNPAESGLLKAALALLWSDGPGDVGVDEPLPVLGLLLELVGDEPVLVVPWWPDLGAPVWCSTS
jgi:hypothetical protein